MMSYKYNNVAILTDNPEMAVRLYDIFKLKYLEIIEFQFYVSPFSDKKQFDIDDIKVVDVKNEDDVEFLIANHNLILSMHSKQIFPDKLVNSIKCINIHPGYNPINRGWYPQVFAIINNLDIGATIHEIDTLLDHGNIIDRKKVLKYSFDTSLTLYKRIVKAELELIRDNLDEILRNEYDSVIPESEGKLFLKSDFNALKEIDLNRKVTFLEAIDYLRAMTHGDYRNAYFIDEDGNKVYVNLQLEAEKRD